MGRFLVAYGGDGGGFLLVPSRLRCLDSVSSLFEPVQCVPSWPLPQIDEHSES